MMKFKNVSLAVATVFVCLGLVACQFASQTVPDVTTHSSASSTIFLVRHAEKTTEKGDPDLTIEGYERAELLADLLTDSKITQIHSSDYKRTRDMAAPLAIRLGLSVELYDPSDLPAIAEKLKTAGGRHLVVGHSNTTAELTKLLGGEGGEPIVEATEYNRLYIVTRGSDGEVSTTLLRFGDEVLP